MEVAVLPTLGVIPFLFASQSNSQLDVIGEILANNTINLLSQSLHLKVISRLSTTKFRKVKWSFTEIHQKLGCDFVLHGFYTEQQNKLIIKFRLSGVTTAEVIWEDEVQCEVREVLDGNSYLVNYLANSVAKKIFENGISGHNADSLDTLDTYALYINAINYMHSSDSDSFLQSKNCFKQILQRYPHNSDIQAFLAQWHMLRMHRKGGWKMRGQESAIKSVRKHIDKALDFNPGNEYAIALKAVIETQLFKDVDGGIELITNGLKGSQYDPRIQAICSLVYFSASRDDEAIKSIEAAIELSPFDPQLEHFYTIAAAAHYQVDNFVLAEQFAQRSIALNSIHTSPLRTLIAIQVAIGEPELAKLTAKRLMMLEPAFTVESWLEYWSGDFQCGQQIAARFSAAGIPLR